MSLQDKSQNWQRRICVRQSTRLRTQLCFLIAGWTTCCHLPLPRSIRKEAKAFIEKFHAAGIKITLLTGDSQTNAQSVANEMQIDKVVAQAKPEDKLTYLRELNKTDVTMMVGDGINDAPTLAGAHISVAMGGGTDVAKASADMVLIGDRLDKLLEARELALKTRKIIRENLAWSLGYNLLILPLAVAGLVAPYIAVVGMSGSSIIVVTNSLRLLKKQGDNRWKAYICSSQLRLC